VTKPAASPLLEVTRRWQGLRSLEPGFAGMTREAVWPVPGPGPLIGAAGDDWFVFGVVAATSHLPGSTRSSWSCSPSGRANVADVRRVC